MEKMKDMRTWYHGSPRKLTTLRTGSTITVHYHLARVFSHKPGLVSINDEEQIQHNGRLDGYLYIIDEPVTEDDIEPHPASTMGEQMEWITKRELRLKLQETLGPPNLEELLSEEDIEILRRTHLNKPL